MDAQDRLATRAVGEGDGDLPVEFARSQQGRVQNVRPIGRGDDDDARLVVEPIHLDEELVERLFALVVATTEARASLPSDRIDLVDEDDRRSRGLCLGEQVADATCADPHEQFHELRGRDAEERHRCFAGDGARHQRLARSGWADEEDAARQSRPQAAVLVRSLEEIDDLDEFALGLVLAGNIRERHLGPFGVVEPCPGPSEAEDAGLALLHPDDPVREETDSSTSGRTVIAMLSRSEPPPVSVALITTVLPLSNGSSAGSSIGGKVEVKLEVRNRRRSRRPTQRRHPLRRPARRTGRATDSGWRCGTFR